MSRSSAPTQTQLEMLVESLETKRWLANGHSRTTHARERTKAAWLEITQMLSRDGKGCIKTWQQWSKYWKDKKAAVKRKLNQICLAKRQQGGVEPEDETVLSPIEERIMAIVKEKQLAIDRKRKLQQFNDAVPGIVPSRSLGQETNPLNVDDHCVDLDGTSSDSLLPTEEKSVPPSPHSSTEDNQPPPPTRATRASPARASTDTSYSRRRRFVGWRRPGGRSSTRRHSQIASLLERCIGIEEQRVATEQMLAQNQKQLINVLNNMSEAWLRQSQALQEVIYKLNNRYR